jgi:hypothetical protein
LITPGAPFLTCIQAEFTVLAGIVMFLSTRIAFSMALVCGSIAWADQPAPIVIRLNEAAAPGGKPSFDVMHLKPTDLESLAKVQWDRERWNALFSVVVDGGSAVDREKRLPLLGTYRVHDGVLRFEPRFPLQPGMRYRATFEPAKLPKATAAAPAVVAHFDRTKAKPAAPTVVQHVYPSADVLPENQFRFYVHFSAPMSQGQAYQHLQLLDASGKPIPFAFLELDEELWDADGKRFTLFFHPGRVKKGLKPREELGPVLEEGKRYTLVVDRKWNDAQGQPLKEAFRKSFRAGPPEELFPNPKTWSIQAPARGTDQPLHVFFPKPLDHALLHRLIWVTDPQGRRVAGTVTVSDAETRWHWKPKDLWMVGTYHLVVDTRLEDVAGNNVKSPFEVDVFHPIQREVKSETVELPIVIGVRE